MITFTIALLALVAGYFFYGRLAERIFGPDDRPTPALTQADGVDYIPLPTWKVFMIQFLNIAGVGPILVLLWERCLALLPIYGLCWAVFLQEPFMITWLVCFRYVTEAKACPNSLVVIWV